MALSPAEVAAKQAFMDSKRAVAIAAKDALSPIKLNYAAVVPPGFQRTVYERQVAKAKQPVPSAEEVQHSRFLEQRRSFMHEARRVFRIADQNTDRVLEKAELMVIAENADVAEQLISIFDADQDGFVSQQEWRDFLVKVWAKDPEAGYAVLRDVEQTLLFLASEMLYDHFDTNQDGVLDLKEVTRFTRLPDSPEDHTLTRVFMSAVDTDNSGTINRTEWRVILRNVWRQAVANGAPEEAWQFINHLYGMFNVPTVYGK